jgi:hypothetical protein
MGVVRREGDWRLDKQDDGVYEVTYEHQPELKIITSDYEPTGFNDERNDVSIGVREVSSYSEAEQMFEEMAQGSPSMAGGFDMGVPNSNEGGLDADLGLDGEDGDLPDLPPGGLLLVGAIMCGFLIQQSGFNTGSTVFLIGAAFLLLPLAVLGLTIRVYQTEGAGAAIEYLVTVQEDESQPSSASNTDDSTEKTPPAPKKEKDAIYFERADQRCEWCEERTDSPEIHHIEPRAEGGSNDYRNLIALCPGCHSKADKGGISKTILRSKVSRQMDEWSKPEKERA